MSWQYTHDDLRPDQWKAFWFMVERKCAGLLLDMGLGKTVIMLSVIQHLKHLRKLRKPVLVVAPLRPMYSVWRQEAAKWKHTRKLTFSIVHGSVKQRLQALDVRRDIYLINPHGLRWLLEQFEHTKKDWPFSWLIVDESSDFKSPGSQRFRKLRHFVRCFKYRSILTGTPTPNSLAEIWAQAFILDEGRRLSSSYSRFKQRYFYQVDHQGYIFAPRRGAEQHVMDSIGDITLRMEARSKYPTIYNPVYVTLPPRARAMYERFEDEMFIQLEAGDVEALNAATLSGRCHQLANGAVYSIDRASNEKIWEPVHDVKLEALQEIIRETGSPVLVAYWFKHDLYRLRTLYPQAPILQDPKAVSRLIAEWQQDRHPVMLVHPASAGHGLDGLQHGSGHTIIFFSLTWSKEKHDQLIARIAGARATNKITVHYVHARGTVDDVIYRTSGPHGLKDRTQRTLLNALKEYKHDRERIRSSEFDEFEEVDHRSRGYTQAQRRWRAKAVDQRPHHARPSVVQRAPHG